MTIINSNFRLALKDKSFIAVPKRVEVGILVDFQLLKGTDGNVLYLLACNCKYLENTPPFIVIEYDFYQNKRIYYKITTMSHKNFSDVLICLDDFLYVLKGIKDKGFIDFKEVSVANLLYSEIG